MSSRVAHLTCQKNQFIEALSVKILVMLLGCSCQLLDLRGPSLERFLINERKKEMVFTFQNKIFCVNKRTLHVKKPDVVSAALPETKPLYVKFPTYITMSDQSKRAKLITLIQVFGADILLHEEPP